MDTVNPVKVLLHTNLYLLTPNRTIAVTMSHVIMRLTRIILQMNQRMNKCQQRVHHEGNESTLLYCASYYTHAVITAQHCPFHTSTGSHSHSHNPDRLAAPEDLHCLIL